MAVSQTSSEPMFINGEWTEGTSGKRIPVYDPSTEEVIAEIPDASAADIDAAVAAARHAFDEGGWPQTSAQERGRILFRIAAKLREEAPQLAELESRNCGKPIVEAEYDIADAATCFEYYGGLANKVSGLVNPVPDNALSLSLKEPVGVAGQIIPWNYPVRHGRVEAGAGDRRRLHLRFETGGADAAHHVEAGRLAGGVRSSCRSSQRRDRAGGDGGRLRLWPIRTWIRWRSRDQPLWARSS